MTKDRLREIEKKWETTDFLYKKQLEMPLSDEEEHQLSANESNLFYAVKELITERRETTVLNKWERNYLISVISGDWLNHKAILESVRKEVTDCTDGSRKNWNRIKLNNEIFKFNLLEGLLAKLVGREPVLEEHMSEEGEK